MNKINLANGFGLSRIVHGQMRMGAWNMSTSELLKLMEGLTDMGITSFDHADIYGNYSCEAILGEVLKLKKSLRDEIEIVTKCGIKLVSEKFQGRKFKIYDYTADYIVWSVNNSLSNFGTDHIDLLLLHRPAPFFDPEEAAKAFSILKRDGKVLHFGVSNFTPAQFDTLNSYTEDKLVTNQVEVSPYCLEHFENGNMDFFMKEKIRPMAWSPMAGGKLMNPQDEKGKRVLKALLEVGEEMNLMNIDTVVYAWLIKHPSTIMPVVGSGKLERINYAVEALNVEMSLEQWYKIYIASVGNDLP